MRCGNCKQNHGSVDEVIQCYHDSPRRKVKEVPSEVLGERLSRGQSSVQRTPVPEHLQSGATVNQLNFIRALLEQTGKTEQDIQPLNQMSFDEASATIVRLKEERSSLPKHSLAPTLLPANVAGRSVPQGTYTVVFSDHEDDRITLRFRAPKNGKWKGTQLVEYLAGPDNTSDYMRCANETADGYRVWNQWARNNESKVMRGINYMAAASEEDIRAKGETYALASGNCYRCNRTLTVPASIHRGLGPECARIIG